MASLMRGLFTGQEFQSLERISIGGSCCVRKVFTMKNMPSSATDLPSACQPPPSAPSFLYTVSTVELVMRGKYKTMGYNYCTADFVFWEYKFRSVNLHQK